MAVHRLLILNSYSLIDKPAAQQIRICAFMGGLAEEGCRAHQIAIEIIDSNDLASLELKARDALERFPDLIHAVGTPNAIIAAKICRERPIVYYGAHPEGVGRKECSVHNMVGIVLSLPFTANYKNFRFLRKLLPDVTRVYVPYFAGTVFCTKLMRDKHRSYRQRRHKACWVPMDSEFIGYRSLAALCDIIGLEYLEFVYRDIDELSHGLSDIDPSNSVVMAYNDNVYCQGAPRTLVQFGIDARVPVIWNNNPEAIHIGALAAFAGCFREIGRIAGKKAARLLAGASVEDVGSSHSSKLHAGINLDRARDLGLSIPGEVLSRFDDVISESESVCGAAL